MRLTRVLEGNHDRWPLVTAGLLFIIAMLVLPLDCVLIQACNSDSFPGEIRVALNKVEPFGHGYGVFYILVTIGILTRCNFRRLGSLVCCSLGAGLAADGIKLFVGRIRPNAVTDNYASTFTGFLPWWESESLQNVFAHSMQSFPSAHAATAFGLAIGLTSVFPRGRWWFFVLAGLVAAQRVVIGLHYPSDVLVGASLGILVGHYLSQRFAVGNPSISESTPTDNTSGEVPRVSLAGARVAESRPAA
jgi:membrane-associated phospholipid phosphatase